MKNTFSFIASLALCLALAIISLGQKTGTSSPVSLKVMIETANSSGVGCAVCSDSGTEYIDGQQGIAAYFDKYGNFYFRFNKGTTARSILVNYASPYLPPVPPPPDTPPFGNHTGDFITFKAGDPYVNLQDMQVGNDHCQCVGTGWTLDTFAASNVTWNNNFHRTGSAFHDDRTSYAVVTCVEADGAGKCLRWEVEPRKTYLNAFGQPVTIACNNNTGQVESIASVVKVEAAKNKQTYTNYGLYSLPFKLTLRKK